MGSHRSKVIVQLGPTRTLHNEVSVRVQNMRSV